jgi:hypothetical protein
MANEQFCCKLVASKLSVTETSLDKPARSGITLAYYRICKLFIFIDLIVQASRPNVIKLFTVINYQLECLSLAGLSNLV